MKMNLLNSFGALALVGLSVSLTPSNLSAHDMRHGEHHMDHGGRCARLPHGSRCVSYRGERCWSSGGCYFRVHPLGGYVAFQPTYETVVVKQPVLEEKTVVVKRPVVKKVVQEEEVVEETTAVEQPVVEEPVVEERVVEQPVVEEAATVVEEEPVLEEEETVLETLPEGAEVVVIGGERCWLRDGVYYRRCGHGYKACHPHGNGKWHNHDGHSTKGHMDHGDHFPKDHNDKGHMPHQTKNNNGMGNHMPHQTKNQGGMNMGGHPHQMGGKHDKHN